MPLAARETGVTGRSHLPPRGEHYAEPENTRPFAGKSGIEVRSASMFRPAICHDFALALSLTGLVTRSCGLLPGRPQPCPGRPTCGLRRRPSAIRVTSPGGLPQRRRTILRSAPAARQRLHRRPTHSLGTKCRRAREPASSHAAEYAGGLVARRDRVPRPGGAGRPEAALASGQSAMGSQISSATSTTRSGSAWPGSPGVRTSPVHTQTASFSRR